MVKTALIIADDAKGLQPVCGIPAVKRLALLTRQLGFDRVHVVSREARLEAAVSGLVGTGEFHRFENEPDLHRVIKEIGFGEEEFVLVLRACHVIDRWSIARLLKEQQGQEVCFLKKDGAESGEAIYLVKGSYLSRLLALLRSGERA